MVREVFGLKEELTLFLRMLKKEIAKTYTVVNMYYDKRVIPLLQKIGVVEANGEIRILTGSS